jgi:hypothetical protein
VRRTRTASTPVKGGTDLRGRAHRAKRFTKPVTQHQQAAGELFYLPVPAQYWDVSYQILHLRRLHRPLEPGPVARSECIRHDEVQPLAKGSRGAILGSARGGGRD